MDGQHHHQHMDGHWGVPNLPPPLPIIMSFNFFIDFKKIIIIVEFVLGEPPRPRANKSIFQLTETSNQLHTHKKKKNTRVRMRSPTARATTWILVTSLRQKLLLLRRETRRLLVHAQRGERERERGGETWY